jgi:kynurenine 3-monooxygenase
METTGKRFSEYQISRKPNDAIAELSYRNFMEMSTKTADEKFLLQKKMKKSFQINIQINGFRFTAV